MLISQKIDLELMLEFNLTNIKAMSKTQDFIITDLDRPNMKDLMDENDILRFTLSNTNVCFANALRRTILSDIDVCWSQSSFEIINVGKEFI
jgi:hypothetical protein